ncbi:MAG: hypothetical protein HUU35_13920 [Armatimonadetes bacterium]|nr:hypothetical protein [Armatimonadota bacterium]
MKALLWAVLLTGPVLAEVRVEFAFTSPRTENLLTNPSFEQVEAGVPSGWRWTTADAANFEVSSDAIGHDGARSLKIVTHTARMSGYLGQVVRVLPETDYLLTAWLRLEQGIYLTWVRASMAGGQRLDPAFDRRVYAFGGLGGSLVPVFLKAEWLPGQLPLAWRPVALRFRTPARVEELGVSIGSHFRAGTGWYDDLQLTRFPGELVCTVTADEDLRAVTVYDHTPNQPWRRSTDAGQAVAELAAAPAGTRRWAAPVTTQSGALQFRVKVVTAAGEEWRDWPNGTETW